MVSSIAPRGRERPADYPGIRELVEKRHLTDHRRRTAQVRPSSFLVIHLSRFWSRRSAGARPAWSMPLRSRGFARSASAARRFRPSPTLIRRSSPTPSHEGLPRGVPTSLARSTPRPGIRRPRRTRGRATSIRSSSCTTPSVPSPCGGTSQRCWHGRREEPSSPTTGWDTAGRGRAPAPSASPMCRTRPGRSSTWRNPASTPPVSFRSATA